MKVKFRKQFLGKIDPVDAGEIFGPEVQPGVWTTPPGLVVGRSWCWEARRERGPLSSVAAFPWPRPGLRIGKQGRGQQAWGRSAPGSSPLGLLSEWEHRERHRVAEWHDTQPQHLTPLGVHLETGCESLLLDPPESCILTCEWGERCLLGFHKDPIRSAHRTAPVPVSARELLVCACLVTLPVPPPKGLPERGRESTEKQQPGAAGWRGGTRLCFGELWGGWPSLCLGLPVDQRCQPPA